MSIVGGCGRVGLPLGLVLLRTGSKVTLIDRDAGRVAAVSAGRMPFGECGANPALREALLSDLLHATTDLAVAGRTDVVIVTVGTPIDEYLAPSAAQFEAAVGKLLTHLRAGQLLIVRSTVPVGLSDRLIERAAVERPGLDVAYCPERILQGRALLELTTLPQIVGAATAGAAERAADLFRSLGVRVVFASPIEAELAKLVSNAYRYVTFAAANQFYLIAQRYGADFNRVRDIARADYPRMSEFPASGFAGGPCLLKDTMQLTGGEPASFLLGHAAMMINEGMPAAAVAQARARHNLRPLTAGILGMAFKGDCDDSRGSLAYKLRKLLAAECARVVCTDPHIVDPSFVTLDECVRQADILFIGACHGEYRELSVAKPLIDIFGHVKKARASCCDGFGHDASAMAL